MTVKLTFRTMTINDRPLIRQWELMDPRSERCALAENWDQWWPLGTAGTQDVLVVEQAGEPAGWAVVNHTDPRTVVVYVAPRHRARRIGQTSLTRLVERYGPLTGTVAGSNFTAVRMLHLAGWVRGHDDSDWLTFWRSPTV